MVPQLLAEAPQMYLFISGEFSNFLSQREFFTSIIFNCFKYAEFPPHPAVKPISPNEYSDIDGKSTSVQSSLNVTLFLSYKI